MSRVLRFFEDLSSHFPYEVVQGGAHATGSSILMIVVGITCHMKETLCHT